MMRAAAILAAVLGLAVVPEARQTTKAGELRAKLSARLETIASDLDGVMGYAIVDLTSGERIERRAREVFPTASTIKIAILYELFRQADEGRVRLGEMRPLDRRHAVGGTGILNELTTPSLSIRDYATLMIALSDNTATNVLIDLLGMDRVTKRMASLGLEDTKLRRRMIDLDAARKGNENVSSPADLAKLLEIVYRGDGLKQESRDELVAILRTPKSSALRATVPPSVGVASKPGTLEGVEVDAGIVYLAGRPYIAAITTTYLKNNAAGEAAIRAASQAAFEYFDRLAKSSEYGRAIR